MKRRKCPLCRRKPIPTVRRAGGRKSKYCPSCQKEVTRIRLYYYRKFERQSSKALGVPTWKRNGWKSKRKWNTYQRRYMREYRRGLRRVA